MRDWLAALRLALAGPASAEPAPSPPLDRLSRLVERLAAEGGLSGAAVILRDGEAVWARGVGFADRAALRRFTPDTPSGTGSIVKTVTGCWRSGGRTSRRACGTMAPAGRVGPA